MGVLVENGSGPQRGLQVVGGIATTLCEVGRFGPTSAAHGVRLGGKTCRPALLGTTRDGAACDV
jgi:hypothetical protein